MTRKEYYWKLRRECPWVFPFDAAKQRCNNPNNRVYSSYGGKGVKVLMTKEDFKTLWFRDKAYLMKQPSIDRVDNDGNYTLENCRFLELKENAQRRIYNNGKGFDMSIIVNRKPVAQYTLKERFVRRYNSIRDAAKAMGVNPVSISFAVSHRRGTRTSCGFIWKLAKI